MAGGLVVWWRKGDQKGVLVDAMKAADIQKRLQEAIEDLQETICEVNRILPPGDEEDPDVCDR